MSEGSYLRDAATRMRAELASAAQGRAGWSRLDWCARSTAWHYAAHAAGHVYHGRVIGNGIDGWAWSAWRDRSPLSCGELRGAVSAAAAVTALEDELREAAERDRILR